MRLVLVAFLLLQDPTDRLGDPDPAVREQAAREFRKTRPLDALRRAKDHADPEIRGRASRLIVEIEREIAQEARERDQRPRAMKRLATDQKPLDGAAIIDGAAFTVKSRAWHAGGTIFETRAERFLEGELEWDVAGVAGRAVERCSHHSPDLVYLPGPPPESPRVTIKGLRRWYCETPIEFKEPKPGESWRSGALEVTVQWPSLVVRVDPPLPFSVLEKTLNSYDIQIALKQPLANPRDTIGIGVGGGGRFVARLGAKKSEELAWCGCAGKPSDQRPDPPGKAKELVVNSIRYDDVPLENVASISITLRKPVEEPFETTSRPVK